MYNIGTKKGGEKGEKIFIGPINILHLKALSFTESNIKLVEESFILKKDALFYQNVFGKIINIEHNICLPTKEEAEDYFVNVNREGKEHQAVFRDCSIMFYNEDDLKPLKIITNKEFKELKKALKVKK